MSPLEAADLTLLKTSRTFYLPIVRLPPNLREAVTSTYLCLRAIDEVEDHDGLDRREKVLLLQGISLACRNRDLLELERLCCARDDLPEVTKRISDWIRLAPSGVASLIWNVNSTTAELMAYWVDRNWRFDSKADLDSYTFGVAGNVGILLSELWSWFDGTLSDKTLAVGFGRSLQAVNMLRNRSEDLARGVDFFPSGWSEIDLRVYAYQNLSLASDYLSGLPPGPAREFCRLPLVLAQATLEALQRGKPKLSRNAVLNIVETEANSESMHAPAQAETVILVDEHDRITGIEEKMSAHRRGALHRAFSIFIINNFGELLLQKRAMTKYHTPNRWSNTCCGHPRIGESIEQASHRRLREEMGFHCELSEIFTFSYRAELDNGLTENEHDHVLIGNYNGQPQPNFDEVGNFQWVRLAALRSDVQATPGKYTPWLKIALTVLYQRFPEIDNGFHDDQLGNAQDLVAIASRGERKQHRL